MQRDAQGFGRRSFGAVGQQYEELQFKWQNRDGNATALRHLPCIEMHPYVHFRRLWLYCSLIPVTGPEAGSLTDSVGIPALRFGVFEVWLVTVSSVNTILARLSRLAT